MRNSIYDTVCPYCNEKNYYSNGEESDLSVEDVTDIRCFKCKKVYPVEFFDSDFEECTTKIVDGFHIREIPD